MYQKIGFIGAGHMGSAIAKRIDSGKFEGELYISDMDKERVNALLSSCPHGVAKNNEEIARECDLIFFAVKPQVLNEVRDSIKPFLENRATPFVICSMAAGVPTDRFNPFPVIRIMPNTPVEIGEGVIAYTGCNVTEKNLSDFRELMQDAGHLFELDESLINAVCALSGCGPAYVYMFIAALAEKGAALGLPKETALQMVLGTVIGAAKMVDATRIDPITLKEHVCSPGGATIEGAKHLDENGFSALVSDALEKAYRRTLELK